MKKILIAGSDSYIGVSLEKYLNGYGGYYVHTVDMRGEAWRDLCLEGYHSVVFVAGIVHRKKGVKKELYMEVNCRLVGKMAEKAKADGVEQFVFMSSMSVYGDREGEITPATLPRPTSFYGISKFEGEEKLFSLASPHFGVFALRPPMVYGRGCPGNYNTLASFVKKVGVFPRYNNQRSMIYIENLCYFIKQVIDGHLPPGVWLPQNREYVCTSHMAEMIAKANGKRLIAPKIFNPIISLGKKLRVEIFMKCFAGYRYSQLDPRTLIGEVDFERSIMLTEGKEG